MFRVNNKDTKKTHWYLYCVALVSLLLTLNIFYTMFWCFYCWLWTCNCWHVIVNEWYDVCLTQQATFNKWQHKLLENFSYKLKCFEFFCSIFHYLIFFQNDVNRKLTRTLRMTIMHSLEPVNLIVLWKQSQ